MPATPHDRLIDIFGRIAQDEGMPRISGQIHAYLLLADEPRSLTEIADALGVSKASVSTNARMLEARGIARREGRVGSRQDHWRAVPRPQAGILAAMGDRFRRHAGELEGIAADLDGPHACAGHKVAGYARFYRQSAQFLDDWAATVAADDFPSEAGDASDLTRK